MRHGEQTMPRKVEQVISFAGARLRMQREVAFGGILSRLCTRGCADEPGARTNPFVPTAVLLSLLAGGGYFLYRQLPSPHSAEFLAANAQIKRYADKIHAASRTPALAEPYLGFDHISNLLSKIHFTSFHFPPSP